MKDFQIVRYISSWRYLIALCTVIEGMVFYSCFSRQQVYTAYATISYTNLDAKGGKTPSGTDVDVNKIYSPNAVADTIEKLESNVSVDFVRSRMRVEPIVSDEGQKWKEAILEEGGECEEYPTDYYITFSVESDCSEDFAKSILNTVLSSYFDFYDEGYVTRAVMPNNAVNIGNDNHNYIEIIEIMKQPMGEILEYLDSNQTDFRSSRAGYSFHDLIMSYQLLEAVSLDRLYVNVLSRQKIKDRAVLVKENNAEIKSPQIQLEKVKIQSAEFLLTIVQYNPKVLKAQEYSTDIKDAETVDSVVLQDIYERKDQEGSILCSKGTYDTLISRYVDYSKEVLSLEQQVEEKQYILPRSQAEDSGTASKNERINEDINDEELMGGINRLAGELNSFHEIVAQVGREYNGYLVNKGIAMQNSMDASSQPSLKIYIATAFVLFFGIGCCGAIVIGRVGDTVGYTLYVDQKAKPPNRLSRDERIESIKKRGTLGTFTRVVPSVDSLRKANRAIGYAAGDKILEETGDTLKTLSRKYGFIGYSGANQFLCLLDNCTGEKAEFMLSLLSESIKQLNEGNPGAMIETRARTADSKETGVYQINKLTSKAYEMKGEKIGQVMEAGLVSVIIATYKREFSMLKEALDGVLTQTYARMKIIVMDGNGGKGERSPQIEEGLKIYPQVRCIKLPDNSGAQVVRNTGIQAGSGEFITFLDDDDLWEPKKLEMRILCFEDPQVGLVLRQGYVFEDGDVEHRHLYHRKGAFKETVNLDGILKSDIAGATFRAVVRGSALDDCGTSDVALPARQDYEIWLQVLKRYRGARVDVPLFNTRIHKGERITPHPMKGIRGYQEVHRKYKKDSRKNKAARVNMLSEMY